MLLRRILPIYLPWHLHLHGGLAMGRSCKAESYRRRSGHRCPRGQPPLAGVVYLHQRLESWPRLHCARPLLLPDVPVVVGQLHLCSVGLQSAHVVVLEALHKLSVQGAGDIDHGSGVIAVHQDCHAASLRDSHQNVMDVIRDDDRVVAVAPIYKVGRENGLVVAFILVTVHVVDLEPVTREGEEECVARRRSSHQPLQLRQDVDARWRLGWVNLHRLLLARIDVMEDADVFRLKGEVFLQGVRDQERVINGAS
mmetsp:Transcript_69656/g.179573  ORF Transcript_69656/g.179573 Transcript_69656/m.179573 type:complete len:253 (-) Transcript_69656:120-878(-)